jgi:sialic acid synthase SpsE
MVMNWIADIGSNHNGDKKRLMDLVYTALDIGCWGVKPQLFKADRLFAGESPIKPEWEFKEEWIPDVAEACKRANKKFGVSVFFEEAVEMTKDYVDFYKISSFDVLRDELLAKCLDTGLPVFVSIGLAEEYLVKQLINIGRENRMVLMHCVSEYPTYPSRANLKAVGSAYINGYSDHTRSPGVMYKAAQYVDYIEFHLDLDGKGQEAQVSEHCWMPYKIAEVIYNVSVGEKAMARVERPREYYLQKADKDGLRPMKEAR